jgi:hypothetical protein
MKLYLAGPMTGYPEFNFPAFAAESARLRALGFEVVNPAELNVGNDGDWLTCMRTDIRELVTCEGIALLPGWEKSKGARIEEGIARQLGFCVYTSAHIIDLIAGLVVLSDKALVELMAAA